MVRPTITVAIFAALLCASLTYVNAEERDQLGCQTEITAVQNRFRNVAQQIGILVQNLSQTGLRLGLCALPALNPLTLPLGILCDVNVLQNDGTNIQIATQAVQQQLQLLNQEVPRLINQCLTAAAGASG